MLIKLYKYSYSLNQLSLILKIDKQYWKNINNQYQYPNSKDLPNWKWIPIIPEKLCEKMRAYKLCGRKIKEAQKQRYITCE